MSDATSDLDALCVQVRKRVPNATFTIDTPSFADFKAGDATATVEWRPGRGFGVSGNREATYGEGPDEVTESLEEAVSLVVELLVTGLPLPVRSG